MKSKKVIHKLDDSSTTEIASPRYHEEINIHMNKYFPFKDGKVFHELVSNLIHVDIHVNLIEAEKKFHILYTTGMSDLDMNVPKEILDQDPSLNKGELFMFLPGDFDFDNNKWIFSVLISLARFPHKYNTFLSEGHTVPNSYKGLNYIPYPNKSSLSCAVLLPSPMKEINQIKVDEQTFINMYFVYLISKRETKYHLKHGLREFLVLMEKKQMPVIQKVFRKSVI